MKKIILSSFTALTLAQSIEIPTNQMAQSVSSPINVLHEKSLLPKKIAKTAGLSLAAAVTGSSTYFMGCVMYKAYKERYDEGTKIDLYDLAYLPMHISIFIPPLIATTKLGIKIKNIWTKPKISQLQNKQAIHKKLAVESASFVTSILSLIVGSIITGASFFKPQEWSLIKIFGPIAAISAWVAYDSYIQIKKLYQQKQSSSSN